MKKTVLIMLVAVLGVVTMNAQVYLGGSLGFGIQSTKADVKGAESVSSNAFEIAPEVGYSLDEKIDLGISIGFGMINTPGLNADKKDQTTRFEIAPYVRYNMVQFGKFSVLAKAEIYFEMDKDKVYTGVNNDSNEVKGTGFGLNVMPVLKYTLSDKFDLLAGLNFMGLTVNHYKVEDVASATNFGLMVDSNNVANLGGGDVPFTIGFAYKF